MNPVFDRIQPKLRKRRAVDASGLFWGLICLGGGLFYLSMFRVAGLLLLATAPLCFFWQLRKWRKDSTIVRDAAAWCQRFAAPHLELPVVDFVVAVVHNADCQIEDLLPSTNLNVLSGFSLEAEVYSGSGFTNANQVWLNDVLHEAKIKGPDPTRFFGSTLGDAIEFVGAEERRG